jgi:hypothetical protein
MAFKLGLHFGPFRLYFPDIAEKYPNYSPSDFDAILSVFVNAHSTKQGSLYMQAELFTHFKCEVKTVFALIIMCKRYRYFFGRSGGLKRHTSSKEVPTFEEFLVEANRYLRYIPNKPTQLFI